MAISKNKDERTRNWTFVVYPESAPNDWAKIVNKLKVPWVRSPLHDKDCNPDGEIKKAHWHVIMFFSNKKSFAQIKEITDSLNAPIPQKVENAKGMVRYLVHLDNPEKYQYDKSDIVSYCGADILKYLTSTGGDKLRAIAEMQEWIDENDCVEFSTLADYARRERFDDWYDIVVNHSTLFLNAYIRSKRYRRDIHENGFKRSSDKNGGSRDE